MHLEILLIWLLSSYKLSWMFVCCRAKIVHAMGWTYDVLWGGTLGCHGSYPTFDSDFSKICSTRKIFFMYGFCITYRMSVGFFSPFNSCPSVFFSEKFFAQTQKNRKKAVNLSISIVENFNFWFVGKFGFLKISIFENIDFRKFQFWKIWIVEILDFWN